MAGSRRAVFLCCDGLGRDWVRPETTPFLDKLRPPLTTLAIPHQQIGAEAARLLLEAIAEPDRPPRSVLLPLSLVVRGSTAPPPA